MCWGEGEDVRMHDCVHARFVSVLHVLPVLPPVQGNHGEDVKELYYYLDATPTHSYLRYLYKYPQQAFPYHDMEHTTAARTVYDPEYELEDTGEGHKIQYLLDYVENI